MKVYHFIKSNNTFTPIHQLRRFSLHTNFLLWQSQQWLIFSWSFSSFWSFRTWVSDPSDFVLLMARSMISLHALYRWLVRFAQGFTCLKDLWVSFAWCVRFHFLTVGSIWVCRCLLEVLWLFIAQTLLHTCPKSSSTVIPFL